MCRNIKDAPWNADHFSTGENFLRYVLKNVDQKCKHFVKWHVFVESAKNELKTKKMRADVLYIVADFFLEKDQNMRGKHPTDWKNKLCSNVKNSSFWGSWKAGVVPKRCALMRAFRWSYYFLYTINFRGVNIQKTESHFFSVFENMFFCPTDAYVTFLRAWTFSFTRQTFSLRTFCGGLNKYMWK